jgi:hypothetical protein
MTIYGVTFTVTELLAAIVLIGIGIGRLISFVVWLTPSKEDDKKLAEIKDKWPWLLTATDKAFQLVKKMTLEGKLNHADRFNKFIEILEGDYQSFFKAAMPESLKQVAEQIATGQHAADKNAQVEIAKVTGSSNPL